MYLGILLRLFHSIAAAFSSPHQRSSSGTLFWAALCACPGVARTLRASVNNSGVGCEVLMLHDMSMMQPCVLDHLQRLYRVVRRSAHTLGGLHCDLAGDFMQIPAGSKRRPSTKRAMHSMLHVGNACTSSRCSMEFMAADTHQLQMLHGFQSCVNNET